MNRYSKASTLLLAALLAGSLAACGTTAQETETQLTTQAARETVTAQASASAEEGAAEAESVESGEIDWFTDRDLEQTADLSEATYLTVSDGEDLEITAAGVYVLSGSARNATVVVDAGDDDKVQLVLDGLTVANDSEPCIRVENADKVFVTTAEGESGLSVTGTFSGNGGDAVIFSRDDLVLNGTGTLTIESTDNGVTSKDDLKVTGGTLVIRCASDGLEANDAIAVADGEITIAAEKDGLNAGNDEDDAAGQVYLGGGTLTITAGSDGVHGDATVQVDDGTLTITAPEGLEGTFVQINGGVVGIAASDDGINATNQSSAVTTAVEINGGEITVSMGAGDTDGIDSNGDVSINGGTVDITGQSPFDYDGTAEHTGGVIVVNGVETDTIANQMMGGRGMTGGGQGGFPGGMPQDGSNGMRGPGGMPGGQMEEGIDGMENGEAFGGDQGRRRGPRPGGMPGDRGGQPADGMDQTARGTGTA